jgi:SAM-dependent methyltransferase
VVAVEPSTVMICQRPAGSAPVVQASATDLPFRRAAFAASLAVLTIHHWPDQAGGLAELARVARDRTVLVTWDPETAGFWLTEEYFPELDVDRRIFPSMGELRRMLGPVAYWRRPEAYLDPGARGAISTFSKFDAEPGLARLRRDLADGTWRRRHGHLALRSELDLGYRIVVARRGGVT